MWVASEAYKSEDREKVSELLKTEEELTDQTKQKLKEVKSVILVNVRDANYEFLHGENQIHFNSLVKIISVSSKALNMYNSYQEAFGNYQYKIIDNWKNVRSVYIAALQAALLAVCEQCNIDLGNFGVDWIFGPYTLLAANKVVKTLLPEYAGFDGVFTAEIVDAMVKKMSLEVDKKESTDAVVNTSIVLIENDPFGRVTIAQLPFSFAKQDDMEYGLYDTAWQKIETDTPTIKAVFKATDDDNLPVSVDSSGEESSDSEDTMSFVLILTDKGWYRYSSLNGTSRPYDVETNSRIEKE